MKSEIWKKAVLIGVTILLLTAAILIAILQLDLAGTRRDLDRFSKMEYNGAFFSMYDISCYSEEDFITYRGVVTVKAEQTVGSWNRLSKYLDNIFSSQNTVTNVFLGLDPAVLWEKSQNKEEKWARNLNKHMTSYIADRQEVSFDILLPTYQLSHWTKLSAAQMEEKLKGYSKLIESLYGYPNVKIYFLGGEQGFIANPANYLSEGQTNEEISRKIFLYTFCDQKYQISPDNAPELFERLISLVEQEWESPAVYPDLSDLCIVFLGDSVLVSNAGGLSIPGVVKGLCGAQAYNCGESGLSASGDPSVFFNLNGVISHFLTQDISGEPNNNFWRGLTEYIEENHEGKKHCFILHVGLNDCFRGVPIENPTDAYDTGTYAGALRTATRTLREAYPEALILVMTPTYSVYETERNIEGGGVLKDYVDAAVRVAEEMGTYCMNNYQDSGINAENQAYFLVDGIHPNETGSFCLGRQIVEYLSRVLSR